MKPSLLLFAIFLRIVCVAQSGSTDTICLPVVQAQKLLIAGQQKKVLEEKISLMQSDIKTLQDRIDSKEKQMEYIEARDSTLRNSYQSEINIMKDQIRVYDKAVSDLQKALRKEKRKRTVTGLLGMAATVGAFLLGAGK